MRINSRGVTLIELLVAMVVLTTGVLGFFFSFQFISRSLTVSRARTLATNLGQERVEALKNLSYYNLLITTAPAVDATITPSVTYDTVNYPPETIAIGGVKFTRYTFVALAQVDNNAISTVTYTYPDTGMKQITTHIVWSDQGVKRKWSLTNLLENPNINPLDGSISGTITRAGGAALPGARVYIEQNPDWNDSSSSSGDYDFRVYHGSYTVRASSAGYYDAVSPLVQTSPGSNTDVDLQLTEIATGTVMGNAWYRPNKLLITGVMLTSSTVCEDNNTHEVEYIELFNATTSTIYIGQTGEGYGNPARKYTFWYYNNGYSNVSYDYSGAASNYWNFVFTSSEVMANRYYLIANCRNFYINGQYVTADATYGTLFEDRMHDDEAGGIGVWDGSTWHQAVGWMKGGGTWPPLYTGTPVPDVGSAQTFGTPEGNQIVRVSSPGASMASIDAYARAYDVSDNSKNFLYPFSGFAPMSAIVTPRSTASGPFEIISGIPATGATVSSSDPYSGSTTAYASYITSGSLSLPYARFALRGVTTGTWTVEVSLAPSYYQQVSTVVVAQGVTTWIPNSSTDPPWFSSTINGLALTGATSNGFVKGQVTGIGGGPLSGITVVAGGVSKVTGSNGNYFASVSSGSVLIVANPNNANPSYVQQIYIENGLEMGETATKNFELSLGGSLTGFITSATSPLPNITVTANIGGSQYGTGSSNTSGVFTIRNLSTGTYTVQAVLDPGMDSTPNDITATVSSTGTLNIGTFTVTGAFGNIAGTVTDSATSEVITSGALILASTQAISATPALIAASSAPAQTPVYAVSSKADGTYTLPVRGNSTYYLSVYVPVVAASGSVSVSTKTYSGIIVYPSVSTAQNIAIP